MRIAVARQNFRTVTGHAGKTRRFEVFEAVPGGTAREIEQLDLPKEMAIHAFCGDGPHSLDAVDVVIAGSAGEGFVRRVASRNVRAVMTIEIDPATAATALVAGTLCR